MSSRRSGIQQEMGVMCSTSSMARHYPIAIFSAHCIAEVAITARISRRPVDGCVCGGGGGGGGGGAKDIPFIAVEVTSHFYSVQWT